MSAWRGLAGAVLSWSAIAAASPPLPRDPPRASTPVRWEETTHQLVWPLGPLTSALLACDGQAKLAVTQVRVRRDAPILGGQVVAPGEALQPRLVDNVEVWLTFRNPGSSRCDAPALELFSPRSWTSQRELNVRRDGQSVAPHATVALVAAAPVAIGAQRLVLAVAHHDAHLEVLLDTGEVQLRSASGAVVATSKGRREVPVPVTELRYRRFPVGLHLPGVSMVQAGSARGSCARFYDLGIDDLYLVRGLGDERGVRDELVLDASFLKLRPEPETSPGCHQHVDETAQYVAELRPTGVASPGREPDSMIAVFGARQLRRFTLPPGAREARLVFGDPQQPSDVLDVDLASGAVTVVQRSAAPRLKPQLDLSARWEAREQDKARYLLERFGARLGNPSPSVLCGYLLTAVEGPYVPTGEAEPLRETWQLACAHGDAGQAPQ